MYPVLSSPHTSLKGEVGGRAVEALAWQVEFAPGRGNGGEGWVEWVVVLVLVLEEEEEGEVVLGWVCSGPQGSGRRGLGWP